MVLWQSDLRVSWQAQWLSMLLHSAAIAVLLLAPWPPKLTPIWGVMLILVLLETVRSQRRIRCCEGEIMLLNQQRLRWRQQEWHLLQRPWITRRVILLSLRNDLNKRQRLWLLRDSMSDIAWRELRQCLMFSAESGQ